MSKLSDALNKMRVFNNWELLKRWGERGKDVVCTYSVPASRSVDCHKSKVWSPSFKTDPDGPWYNHGAESFLGNRAESLPLALAWASEKYGIEEWATSPFGGKIPKDVLKKAKQAVKEDTA